MFHIIWYVLIGLNLGGYSEIGDARAHDDLLDDRARHHRIDHRGLRYSHFRAPQTTDIIPPASFFSTLGAILVLFVGYKLKIHLPTVNPF
jgi:hypothetical protein